jgi:HEAT repeat protein
LWNLERPSFPRLLHQDSQFPVDVSVYRELAAALTYHDVSIRRAAANDLRQLYYFYDSPRSDEKDRILRPAVTAALEDRDVWVRLFTANAMMRFGASSLVIPALDREFSGGDVEIRRHIVQMLWSSGVHRPLLLRAIRDPDVQIRRIASNRFRYEHNLDQQSRLLLKSSLCDSDFQVRLNIASALCDSVTAESGIRSKYEWNKGDDTPRLCARIAIESFARPVIESHEIAVPLFKSLAASNPEVFVELKSECLRHLKHADHSVRMANATALHAMQAEDDAVVSTIVEILADPKRWETYRHDCTQILFRMGPKAKAAIPTLIAMLGKPIGYVDYTLSKLGPDVIPALKPLLTASSDNDRMNAIRVCRWLGPMAKDLVPLIIPAIRELPASNKLDRFDAISVLGLIGPDAGEAMPLLLVYIDDKENKYGVRGRSVEILLKLGPKAKMALPLIREMAAEPNAGPFIKSTLKALEELP